MNLILHQFKTDWRHFWRGLLVLWLAYAAELIFDAAPLPMEIYSIRQDLLPFLQCLAAACLIPQIIQADSLVGASAQWLARPLRRPHLFAAKSAFILICVVLPRLVPQIIICGIYHYPWPAALASLAGLLLIVLTLVGCLVALAALTPDRPRFFLSLGVLLAVFFIWSALISVHYSRIPVVPEPLSESATVASYLLLAGCALVVWVVQVFAGQRRLGFALLGIGLVALPCFPHVWSRDFLGARVTPLPALAITILNETNPPVAGTGGQRLWSAFAVSGLPRHDLVVVENGRPSFHPNGKTKSYDLNPFRNDFFYQRGSEKLASRVLPMESAQQDAYVAIIRDFFPPETLWNDLPVHNWPGFPDLSEVYKQNSQRPLLGGLYWQAEFDQFQVTASLRAPLRPGTWQIAPGRQLVIHTLTPAESGVTLMFEEISADPPLLPALYGHRVRIGQPSPAYTTFVLYHPDGGQAEILGNSQFSSDFSDFINGETRQYNRFTIPYPLLPARLVGVALQDYLDKSLLCVFTPVYQGTFHQTYQENNFDLARVQSQSSNAGDDQKNAAVIESLALPAAPTIAQISEYLDTLLPYLPDNPDPGLRQRILPRLEAIGASGIPLLLARLPLAARSEADYVFPFLTKFATRAQLPELRDALSRDVYLAGWFHQMKWDDDARDVLLGQLPDHRRVFTPVALGIVADTHDPATYPDLTWHFVRLENQQQIVATNLAACPGFDLPGAIREAWQRVLLGLNQPGDLPLLAARQGLTDAFNQAVIQLESRANLSPQQQDKIRQLAALANFSGPPETAQVWLSSHLGQFQYDPVTRRYLLSSNP